MYFSKFPPSLPSGPTFEHTHHFLRQHGWGAVLSAAPHKICQQATDGQYYGEPDFSVLDIQVTQSAGLEQHIHPVMTRSRAGLRQDFHLLHGRVDELGMPIVERYADTVSRWTLAHELTLAKAELWDEIVNFYKTVKQTYPNLKLYCSDFAVRQPLDREGILTRLEDLAGIIHGFVVSDYVDFSSPSNNVIRYMKLRGGMIHARRFAYLCDFWKELRGMGIQPILESAAFADEDTPVIRNAQQSLYQALIDLCHRQGAEFWMWCPVDDASRDFMSPERRPHCGFWDADGNQRLSIDFK